ncbi:hypothetical protein EJB05_46430, partial [Eragrostis curvula]
LLMSRRTRVPHGTTKRSQPSASGRCYSASSGPTIWVRSPPDWHFMFCIRMDSQGSFHLYPDQLGGPFQSLQEAEDAIDHYVNGLPRPARCDGQDKVTSIESQIRHIVFYPDGTPKNGPNSPAEKNPNYRERRLVQVVLDQYNDDHKFFGDRAHELKGDVKFHWFDEDDPSYYHFNFMTKTGKLFFAELLEMQIGGDSVVSCCCIIGRNDKGLCYGCIRDGSTEMKHPKNTDAYTGGRVDCRYLTFGGDPFSDSDDDEDTQMAKLWIKFKGRHAPFVRENIITWK